MKEGTIKWVKGILVVCLSFAPVIRAETTSKTVSFARDILPILSDRCFKCHGFDEAARKADLALHHFAAAIRDGAIVPGKPEESELMARLQSSDPEEVMPPPQANKPTFSKAELALFETWILEGATYEQHWAFVPPSQDHGATLRDPKQKNPIDDFIESGLKRQGLDFSPPAHAHALARRLYFDLIGLPPTLEEADAFVTAHQNDPEKAIERLLDDLQGRPEYGERWAREWLDLARYADTNGYEKDRERSMWPYRDWVIKALNNDMPYDQFTIEQIAGDMLPNATQEQKIATGFHRNTMLNEEGGIDPLEFRYLSMVDRVATTGTVWLGLTVSCAQCHTHKFDPITHSDYFSLMALLNNTEEPVMDVLSSEILAKRKEIVGQIWALEDQLIAKIDPQNYFNWYRNALADSALWRVITPIEMESNSPKLSIMKDGSIFASGDFTKRDEYKLSFAVGAVEKPITAIRIEPIPDERLPGKGSGIAYYEGDPGDFFLSEVEVFTDGKKQEIKAGSVSFGEIRTGFGTAVPENVYDGDPTSGWATGGQETKRQELVLNFARPFRAEKLDLTLLFNRHFAAALGRFRISVTTDTGKVAAQAGPFSNLSHAQGAELMRYYVRVAPEFAREQEQIAALEAQIPAFPTTLVMREWQEGTRPTHRHHRGDFVQPKEMAFPAVPAFLGKLPEDQPADRLALAKWLVSEQNPLAARAAVNRAWQAFFGRGIVTTPGDFGYQSALPSHPELLDFLALYFRDHGWSFKKLHRLILTSRTYQQDGAVSARLLQKDPTNTFLSRGPRFRLSGEMIRDAVLRSSGLLVQEVGGPSVRPPQFEHITMTAYGRPAWVSDTGPNRHRRSLYTLSKRTAPFAALLAFDGPTGENCTTQRNRTNTPLQALTLLNDEMFLEAARALAAQDPVTDVNKKIDLMFQRVLSRPPSAEERSLVASFYQDQIQHLLLNGQNGSHSLSRKEIEETAWMLVARTLINLDEAVTKG